MASDKGHFRCEMQNEEDVKKCITDVNEYINGVIAPVENNINASLFLKAAECYSDPSKTLKEASECRKKVLDQWGQWSGGLSTSWQLHYLSFLHCRKSCQANDWNCVSNCLTKFTTDVEVSFKKILAHYI